MYRVTFLRIYKFFVDLARYLLPVLTLIVKILLWILAALVVLLFLMLLF